jgi:hypothetical protein
LKFEGIKSLSDEEFLRLTGVKKATFEKMVEILKVSDSQKKKRGGRPNKLNIEDQLLLTLEYLREYRTYFHIGTTYGISESSAYKSVRWVEDTLIKHPDFHLPGRKALQKSDVEYEVILVDATESPIERPKKNRKSTIPERRKGTL